MTPYYEEVCGTCKHCKIDKQRFRCCNEESFYNGEVCNFDDECDEWEEKEQ